jgi:glycosyltransferase involved in cell wall biosynthesis
MRVAHLLAGATEGGAELFFERLMPALSAAGDDVLPIVRGRARAARLRAAGAAPRLAPFAGTIDPLTGRLLAHYPRRFAPRVAVAWMGRAAYHTPAGPWVLVGRLGGTYRLSRFRHCDHLVANTPGLASWIAAQGWPAGRVHYLPNFVPDHAGARPAALPVPPGAPTVLAMGRLHRDKGFDVLLAAIARLPDVHALIAGDGPERAALHALARRAGLLPRVHFLGWRADTASLLAAADMLVCPSRREPLGNQILEAFSAAKPVVAAMADGPAWLLDQGRRGILVPGESGVALAAGIEGMLRNRAMASSFGAAGRACFEAAFAAAPVVAAWHSFCQHVKKAGQGRCPSTPSCEARGRVTGPEAPDPPYEDALEQPSCAP